MIYINFIRFSNSLNDNQLEAMVITIPTEYAT